MFRNLFVLGGNCQFWDKVVIKPNFSQSNICESKKSWVCEMILKWILSIFPAWLIEFSIPSYIAKPGHFILFL